MQGKWLSWGLNPSFSDSKAYQILSLPVCIFHFSLIRPSRGPGTVAHTRNPSTLEGQGGWIPRSAVQDQPGEDGETPVSTKNTKKLAKHGGRYL